MSLDAPSGMLCLRKLREVELGVPPRQIQQITLRQGLIPQRGEEDDFPEGLQAKYILLIDEVECFIPGNSDTSGAGGLRVRFLDLLRAGTGAEREKAIQIDVLLEHLGYLFGQGIHTLQFLER